MAWLGEVAAGLDVAFLGAAGMGSGVTLRRSWLMRCRLVWC